MTTEDIEQAILGLFRTIYEKEYTGKIVVKEIIYKFPGEEPQVVGYELKLGLNKDEKPLTIACDGTAEEFLKIVEKELHERSLDSVIYFTAIQLYNQ